MFKRDIEPVSGIAGGTHASAARTTSNRARASAYCLTGRRRSIGARARRVIAFDAAPFFSPPPCGEGSGVGVLEWGTCFATFPDPPPRPSPSRNRVYAGFGPLVE